MKFRLEEVFGIKQTRQALPPQHVREFMILEAGNINTARLQRYMRSMGEECSESTILRARNLLKERGYTSA